MKLTVLERLRAQGLLPGEGDFATLKVVRKARETLSFNDEELELLEFRNVFVCQKCSRELVLNLNQSPPQACDALSEADEVCGGRFKHKTRRCRLDKDPVSDIDLSPKARELIARKLRELDKQGKLTETEFSLYEKFVEADE